MHRAIHRRTLLSGAGAVLATLALPRRAGAAASGKILIIGGSAMAGALGLFLQRRLTEMGYTLKRRAKSSSGLARPDFFDWPTEASKLIAQHSPDATLLMFGGNDGQGLHMGKGADPKWIRWHEEGWSEEYRRRVGTIADALSPAGQKVLWLGMPVMKSPKLTSRVQRMNDIFRAEMDARAHGHYVDTWPILSDDEGKYTEHAKVDGKRFRLRADDGVNLTVKGATYMVDQLAPQIDTLMQG